MEKMITMLERPEIDDISFSADLQRIQRIEKHKAGKMSNDEFSNGVIEDIRIRHYYHILEHIIDPDWGNEKRYYTFLEEQRVFFEKNVDRGNKKSARDLLKLFTFWKKK